MLLPPVIRGSPFAAVLQWMGYGLAAQALIHARSSWNPRLLHIVQWLERNFWPVTTCPHRPHAPMIKVPMTRTAVEEAKAAFWFWLHACPTHARSVRSLAGFPSMDSQVHGDSDWASFSASFFFLTVLDKSLLGFCANTTLYVTAASSDREEETGGAGQGRRPCVL